MCCFIDSTKVEKSNAEEDKMKCNIRGCTGEYEGKNIIHTIRYKGELVIFDHVPVQECEICGDVLIFIKTVRKIEKMLQKSLELVKQVPVYEYA